MKLRAAHLLIVLILALLGAALFTHKMVEGLTGRGGATDPPVDPQTLDVLPYDPLVASRNLPSGGMPMAGMPQFNPALGSIPTASEINAQGPIVSPMSALPQGISFDDIPDGEEDLYIKKSEIVPPVCPACPTIAECPREKPCPPCPACARCPEPAFECKKVPNYASDAAGAYSAFLPRPVLTDFSSFGM